MRCSSLAERRRPSRASITGLLRPPSAPSDLRFTEFDRDLDDSLPTQILKQFTIRVAAPPAIQVTIR